MNSQLIYSSYKQVLKLPFDSIPQALEDILLPRFEEETLTSLISEFNQMVKKEPTLLRVDDDVLIVGDLHGNLVDLLRIFAVSGLPPAQKFLFLGDYVDRGEFSIEVITLLMAMKVLYPNHIYMIRGNHEVESINKNYGFLSEITETYQNEHLWPLFNSAFANLSLACVVGNQLFCVHGGLSPQLATLNDIAKIQKPVLEIPELVDDLLWSDPTTHIQFFYENSRGKGYKFGPQATHAFLNDNGLSLVVRGHECIAKGVDIRKPVVTVFSSSHYSANVSNLCGMLKFTKGQIIPISLPECKEFSKVNVSYFNVVPQRTKFIASSSSLLSLDATKLGVMSSSTLKLIPSTTVAVKSNSRLRMKSLTPLSNRSMMGIPKKGSMSVIPKMCPITKTEPTSSESKLPSLTNPIPPQPTTFPIIEE